MSWQTLETKLFRLLIHGYVTAAVTCCLIVQAAYSKVPSWHDAGHFVFCRYVWETYSPVLTFLTIAGVGLLTFCDRWRYITVVLFALGLSIFSLLTCGRVLVRE